MTTTTLNVTVDGIGPVPVTVTEHGDGRPFLLLHGGEGRSAVQLDGFACLLATREPARVLVAHPPGVRGRARPEGLDSIRSLARLYVRMLDELSLTGVTVVGNSIGGWIAAEIALLGSPRVSGVVLADAAGLELSDSPIADFFSLTMDQVADLSYYRPDAFRLDLEHMPDAQKAAMAANRSALNTYAGRAMADPGLLDRLPSVTVPVLVIWGEADRIIPVEHGRAYAKAIPNARFLLLPETGHLPQLEAPDRLLAAVWDFASGRGGARHFGGQHVHPGPVRAVLPRPARHDRRRPAAVGGADRGRDGPVRHGARHGRGRLTPGPGWGGGAAGGHVTGDENGTSRVAMPGRLAGLAAVGSGRGLVGLARVAGPGRRHRLGRRAGARRPVAAGAHARAKSRWP